MIEPYGIAATLIALLMMLFTLREFLRKGFDLLTFMEWIIVWLSLFFTGSYPEFYKGVAAALGMATPIHLVTTFSIIALFAIIYQLHQRIVEMDKKLVKIVQHMTLKSKVNKNCAG